jgi:hypothetical protein
MALRATTFVAVGRHPPIKHAFSLQRRTIWEIMRLQFFPTQESWTMNKTVLKVGVLALFLGMAGGCATTGGDDAGAAANQAAEAARAAADRAAQAAADAQSSADRALSAATEAQACCEANRETMERMFRKASSK